MKLDKEDYFSDDCIVKDNFFISIEDLLKCPLCNKILKEPYMCKDCQSVYCKKCLENNSNLKKCPKDGKEITFIYSIVKNDLLSKLKYKCKKCSKIVIQTDIKSHLEENCKHEENNRKREKTLAEIIRTKKQLIKLSEKEIQKKKIDNTLNGK